MTERVRWRMTLDELCHAARTTPQELERWRALGVFGDRWKEPRDRGVWRHITKLVAHRAVLMRTLLSVGLTVETAARIARTHEVKDRDLPLTVTATGIQIQVARDKLNLP
jgi:myo-inositol catabolism protein IolC